LSSDVCSSDLKDAVGTPGDWDLVALEEAAHEAMATGEGGGFV